MSVNTELTELAESIFADAASSDTGFDAKLWKTLDDTGLARLTLPADSGGSEASFADSAIVLTAAGAHAARVPLVETDLQAGWLLTSAGIPIPDGPLTVATGDLDIARTHERASGTLRRVPWARSASVVMLAGDSVLLFDPAGLTVADGAGVLVPGEARGGGANLAEEPRDTVTVDGVVTAASIGDHAGTELRLRGALGRACLLAGAARGALAASVQYAGERVQFGRPIGKFQAIQQQLALAAAEVAAAWAAAAPARSRRPRHARPRRPGRWPGSPTRCTGRSASPASTTCGWSPPGCGPGGTRTAPRRSGTTWSGRWRWRPVRKACGP